MEIKRLLESGYIIIPDTNVLYIPGRPSGYDKYNLSRKW